MQRAAIYWAPAATDPLSELGASWLGRDARSNNACRQPDFPGLADITAAPRRYGFHATLRPPMGIATSLAQLQATAAGLAAATADFALPDLEISLIDGFLALTLATPSTALQALCDRIILATDRHRALASPQELARRREAPLTPKEEHYLQSHGYPYVRDAWQFHITLTSRLPQPLQARLRAAAARHFRAEILRAPRSAGAISLFIEPAPNAPLALAQDFPLQHP